MQQLSRVKSLDGPRVRGISLIGKEKVSEGKDLLTEEPGNLHPRLDLLN